MDYANDEQDEPTKKTVPSLEDFEEAARRFVAKGWLRDTGRRRDAMILYQWTELGFAHKAAVRLRDKH